MSGFKHWIEKNILKVAAFSTVLGASGAVVKNPDDKTLAKNDETGERIEVVSDAGAKSEEEKQEFDVMRDVGSEMLAEVAPIPLISEAKAEAMQKTADPFSMRSLSWWEESNVKVLATEIAQMPFGDLLEKGIISEEFLANYEYSVADVNEMRSNPGNDAIKLEKAFKKWRSGKNHSQCLGGVNETFGMILGVRIPCETNRWGVEIRWASKAQLDKVEPLFYMGIYNKDGKGNIAKDVIQQSAYVVTQFNKGKEGCQGHIGYNCFVGTTQYEYSDGKQETSRSLNHMKRYYGPDCKVYGFKSTKIPTAMANVIAKDLVANSNFYLNSIVNIYERLGIDPMQSYSKTDKTQENTAMVEKNKEQEPQERIKKAKIRVAKRDASLTAFNATETDAVVKDVDERQAVNKQQQQQKYALKHYNRLVKSRKV